MTLRSILIFSLLASFFLLSSCRNMKEVQCTGVKGFKVNSVSAEAGIDGDVLIGIKNPNAFGFSIYKSGFDVTYSGIYLGKAKLTKRVHINGNAEEVYSFNLKNDLKGVNLIEVMKLLSGAMFKNTIEVKGDLKIGKLLIKKRIPVDIKEKVKLN